MHTLTTVINHAFFAALGVLAVTLAYHEVKSYYALKRKHERLLARVRAAGCSVTPWP